MREKGLLFVCVVLTFSMLVAGRHKQKMKLDSDSRAAVTRRLGGKVVQIRLIRLDQAECKRERKKVLRENREPKAINHYAGDDEQ